MPYDPSTDVIPQDGWAVLWAEGTISVTASTRTDAITAFLKLWRAYDPEKRSADWRRWKRHGCRVVRVVTHSLAREAQVSSILARAQRAIEADLDDGVTEVESGRYVIDLDKLWDDIDKLKR